MGRRFDIRAAVGDPSLPRSDVWHFWSRNDQVYVVHGRMGHVQKFSFHTPNICRLAYTKEFGTPRTLSNRATHEWRRDATPQKGSRRVVRVLRVFFPTDVLSTAIAPPTKNIRWIKPAMAGGATVLDLMYTRDDEATLRAAIAEEPGTLRHEIIDYKKLTNDEAFCISSWVTHDAQNTLRIPASHGHKQDLIVLPNDPNNTGRPVRLITFSNPKDGDFIQAWEFGGYWHSPLTDDEWVTMRQASDGKPTGRI